MAANACDGRQLLRAAQVARGKRPGREMSRGRTRRTSRSGEADVCRDQRDRRKLAAVRFRPQAARRLRGLACKNLHRPYGRPIVAAVQPILDRRSARFDHLGQLQDFRSWPRSLEEPPAIQGVQSLAESVASLTLLASLCLPIQASRARSKTHVNGLHHEKNTEPKFARMRRQRYVSRPTCGEYTPPALEAGPGAAAANESADGLLSIPSARRPVEAYSGERDGDSTNADRTWMLAARRRQGDDRPTAACDTSYSTVEERCDKRNILGSAEAEASQRHRSSWWDAARLRQGVLCLTRRGSL